MIALLIGGAIYAAVVAIGCLLGACAAHGEAQSKALEREHGL